MPEDYTHVSPAEYASTDELLNELKTRFSTFVFSGSTNTEQPQLIIMHHGGIVLRIGLAETVMFQVRMQLAQMLWHHPENEDNQYSHD